MLRNLKSVDKHSSRHDMELLADYYAIVRTMEKLEKAYIGGHIADDKVYEQVNSP